MTPHPRGQQIKPRPCPGCEEQHTELGAYCSPACRDAYRRRRMAELGLIPTRRHR